MRLSSGFLILGAVTVALVTTRPDYSKISILESTFGIMFVLIGVYLLNGRTQPLILRRSHWIAYAPIVVGISVGLLSPVLPPWATAVGFALALTMLFFFSGVQGVSSRYIAVATLVVGAAVGLTYFYYYPFDAGIDSWGYIAVASGISQTGHFTSFAQPDWPTSSYYFPFPIMSIVASVVSTVTSLSLPVSLVIFPGALIILQPVVVYLLALRISGDRRASAFAAIILVTESAMVELIHSPMAESVALSTMFMVMLMLADWTHSRSRIIIAFALYFTTAVLHALVAIVCLVMLPYLIFRRNRSRMPTILPLSSILVGYLVISGASLPVASSIGLIFLEVIAFLAGQPFRAGAPIFPPGTSGIFFIWWGLPAALALCAVLIRKVGQARKWAMLGLAILGLSFGLNLTAPDLDFSRYGGLIAWMVLAVCGGITMKSLIRTPRQLLLVAPLISLVCVSALISPTLSPQFGFIRLSQTEAPTTTTDRIALDWVNTHLGSSVLIGDVNSAAYSVFSGYQAGHFSITQIVGTRTVLSSYPIGQHPDRVLFVRWPDIGTNSTHPSCALIGPFVSERKFNVIYNNGCGVLVSGT